MNSAAAAKRSGLRGARTSNAFRKVALDDAESDQRERLFRGDNAAGDDHRPRFAGVCILLRARRERGVASGRLISYFRLPMTFTRSGGRSQCANAVGVRGRLHEKDSGISKRRFQEWAEVKAKESEIFLVTREGTVRRYARWRR